MLTPYLRSVYHDGGRGEAVSGKRCFDCWGLVRAVRHELYGLPLLPSHGAVTARDKQAMTEVYHVEAEGFTEGPPCPAAIAAVWKSGLCVHVAVCVDIDGRLGVLESSVKHGALWLSVDEFERRYLTVRYLH